MRVLLVFVNSHLDRQAEPRKRPLQRRSREMVDRILDAAARIFVERGYHGTTTNHVAEAAEVSVGSVYQYFPNKDALLVALGERHLEEAVVQLGQVAEQLRAAMEVAEIPSAPDLRVTTSVGLARFNPGESVEALLTRADNALYRAKESGRNRVVRAEEAQ